MYLSKNEYKLVDFRKSKAKGKKYAAVLRHRKTGNHRLINFGALGYEQYRDNTGVKLYSHLNHGDQARRLSYHAIDTCYKAAALPPVLFIFCQTVPL
jgi:hypothetical protein